MGQLNVFNIFFYEYFCLALYVTACVEGIINGFGQESGAFIPVSGGSIEF